ncbi:relaxase domain-containing protein [Pseudonocardia xinjiangensis]|uniref:relaxase domain-containing protein n=1 Tax=Pseudonocardia xinjiangensis TaxID=75289 RepID=UPI003D93A3D4
MLSIATGHSIRYFTDPVAKGRESYYTGAVAAGEPPGQWYGGGAAALGQEGEVDADLMEAVYTRLLDPRDPAAHLRDTWDEAAPLAAGHRRYRSADEVYETLLEANRDAAPEQRAELRAQASGRRGRPCPRRFEPAAPTSLAPQITARRASVRVGRPVSLCGGAQPESAEGCVAGSVGELNDGAYRAGRQGGGQRSSSWGRV